LRPPLISALPTTMAIATTTARALRTIACVPDLNGAQRIFRQVRLTKEILSCAVTSRIKRAARFDTSRRYTRPLFFYI
jgi:hypothetical protein